MPRRVLHPACRSRRTMLRPPTTACSRAGAREQPWRNHGSTPRAFDSLETPAEARAGRPATASGQGLGSPPPQPARRRRRTRARRMPHRTRRPVRPPAAAAAPTALPMPCSRLLAACRDSKLRTPWISANAARAAGQKPIIATPRATWLGSSHAKLGAVRYPTAVRTSPAMPALMSAGRPNRSAAAALGTPRIAPIKPGMATTNPTSPIGAPWATARSGTRTNAAA